jgi:trehalose 6-phosphate synthase/phosphatase
VNPYDVTAVASSLARALAMSEEEQGARMRRLRRRVLEHDVHAWAGSFLDRLAAARPNGAETPIAATEPSLTTLLLDVTRTKMIHLLLDYDGTLVPIARAPELAAPDADVLSLLAELATADGIRLALISGRPRETLDRWFGDLPLALWAEHGFWSRSSPQQDWQAASTIPLEWLRKVQSIFNQFAADTPGAQVETKSASMAWHYRRADREFGARQAHELRMLLGDALSNQPLEVVEGKKVIEVRLRGVSKALVARRLNTERDADSVLVAIGDDRTDEDLFRALPASSLTIAVGSRPAGARFRVPDYRAVRRLLRLICESPRATADDLPHGEPPPLGVTPRSAAVPR